MYIPKKALLLVATVVGLSLAVHATWANFGARADNSPNVFSNGTLVLSVKKGNGTACLSSAGGNTDTNSNSSCDVAFNEGVKKPGDATTSELITVKNDGSIDGTVFRLFSSSCANADNTESYHGSGNPCSKLALYVQQYSDAGGTTPSVCLYGGGTATACEYDETKTVAAFSAAHPDAASGLAIGSGLAAGGSVYVRIGVKLPSNADNSHQGRKATWDLSWYLGQ